MIDKSLLVRFSAGRTQTTEVVPEVDIKSVAQIVCGFLNGDGGTVYCGVAAGGQIPGVGEDANEQARSLEITLKKHVSPMPFLSTEVIDLDEAKVIAIEVPQGVDRPYVFDGGIWVRSEASTRLANISELRQLLNIDVETVRWERRSSPQVTDDDLDADEVRAVVRDAQRASRFPFSDPSDDRLVLNDLSLYTRGNFTNAGDALFTRLPARRHPQCRAQFLVVQGNKLDSSYVDQRSIDGPLVRVCTELYTAIQATVATRTTFDNKGLHRTDQPAYDFPAIREGVVNAFVHRDYSVYSGGLKVIVYSDRIEIWNSGSLPDGLKPSDLKRDHPSILVNPDIAQIFYLRGYMERIGRGTELIAIASKRLGAAPPKWQISKTGVTLTIFSAHAEETRKSGLNERQAAFLEYLGENGPVSAREYAARFGDGLTGRQARRDLDELVKLRIISVSGGGRSTLYVKR